MSDESNRFQRLPKRISLELCEEIEVTNKIELSCKRKRNFIRTGNNFQSVSKVRETNKAKQKISWRIQKEGAGEQGSQIKKGVQKLNVNVKER